MSTGIIFVLDVSRHPSILRYVIAEKHSFPAHVAPGESLLITDEDILAPAGNGTSAPDPQKAMAVVLAALTSSQLRAILW